MPFTFSHPAVVIPVAKKRLILSAAIIGSMAPDFEYFLKLSTNTHFGHTFPGIFLFSFPVGLFVIWLFHTFIKQPAIDLLPMDFQSRLSNCTGEFNFFPFSRFANIVFSLLLGIVSHIIWDSFTHQDGFFVKIIPFLQTDINIVLLKLPLYNLLQHISTVIGIFVIAGLILKWYKNSSEKKNILLNISSDRKRLTIILAIIFVSFSSGIFFSSISLKLLDNLSYIRQMTGKVVVFIISFAFISFLVYSAYWHMTIFNATKSTKNTKG